MYKRILIATDGGTLSKKAVISGVALAAGLGAEVIAYTAVARYPQVYYEGAIMLAPEEIARIDKTSHDQAQAIVDALQVKAQSLNVKATTLIGHDPIAEGIINAAKKHKCDLIVMASHGRKGFKRLLLGSETLDVLTHSHIPVLVLR